MRDRFIWSFVVCSFVVQLSSSASGRQIASLCKHSGQRFVYDHIQFQCFMVSETDSRLDVRPIGCVPSNTSNGDVILPGLSFTGEHFRYSCVRRFDDTLTLKITHCVDSSGGVVALGEYFMQRNNENGEHESMECVGDELRAKKVVFKWSKCRRKNGEQLTEGNFLTESVTNETLRSAFQSEQIVSCQREGSKVTLQCTGCVAINGAHVAVSAYTKVYDQWTQCRRYTEGCRLINVTDDYVDCKHEGRNFSNGEIFTSQSGRSSYTCEFGVVTKQGCIINNEFVALGEVRYSGGVARACEHKDEIADLGPLKGCTLEDGSIRKFMETWTDENQVKMRCSWSTDTLGQPYAKIIEFACIHHGEEVPLNKVVQLADGAVLKCAAAEGTSRPLTMRPLMPHEQDAFFKQKTKRLSLVEFFAVGGKSSDITNVDDELHSSAEPRVPTDELNCQDYLPFCYRLSNYCSHSTLPETGLLIEAYEEHARMQEVFERLSGAKHDSRRPIGCEDQLTSFRKIQVIVELACQRTCRKCFLESRRERLVANLEHTAHCGW